MRVMYIKPDEFQELPSYLSPPLFNAMFGSFTTVPAPKGNKNPESTPSWMDVAKSQDIPEPVAEAAPSYAPTTRVQQLTRNVLNSDVEVIGSLRFSDDLLIDGTVEGDISSEGVLSVGQNAVIRAEINTKSVIIHGKVIGNVTVTDRVELKSTAELVGDIQAASLAIEGAIFRLRNCENGFQKTSQAQLISTPRYPSSPRHLPGPSNKKCSNVLHLI